MTAEGDLEPGTEGGFCFDVAALSKIQHAYIYFSFSLLLVGLCWHAIFFIRMPEPYMRKRLDPICLSLRLPQ